MQRESEWNADLWDIHGEDYDLGAMGPAQVVDERLLGK